MFFHPDYIPQTAMLRGHHELQMLIINGALERKLEHMSLDFRRTFPTIVPKVDTLTISTVDSGAVPSEECRRAQG